MNKPAIATICLSLLFGAGRAAQAQYYGAGGNIEGFTVAGKGFVVAKPDLVEVDLDVIASSELTADAIVKYRDAKRRVRDAFTALKLGNVVVDERGLLVDQKGAMQSPYFFDYQPNSRNKTEVQLTRKLVVKASNLRKMDEEGVLQLVGRLLDVAQDAGAKVGSQNQNSYYYYRWGQNPNSGLVRFVLEDFDKLQEEAYEKAIADARTRAERLARLSKVELGPVIAVSEISVPADRQANMNMNMYGNMNTDDEPVRKRLEIAKFQEIPVRVELLVRFAIQHKSDGKARTP
jgi:uncharacterized protein